MRTSFSPRRLARHSLAIVFAACATTFSVLWIFQTRHSTPRPGFTSYEYSAATRAIKVGEVLRGSPAELAGLRPGDQIVAIDGWNLENLRPFYEAFIVGRKEVVELTVEQPGSAAGQRLLRLVVRGGRRVPERTMRLEDLLGFPLDYYPVGFLIVGVTALLLRPDDRNAWLLALLLGGFLAIAPLFEGNIPSLLRGFVVFYKIVMSWSSLALFYYFFAVSYYRKLTHHRELHSRSLADDFLNQSPRLAAKSRPAFWLSLFSNVLTWHRIPDLEVLYAIEPDDPVKSRFARKPGRGPENSGTRSILLQVLRIGREGQL
jgi:hypothetical protein